MRAMIETVQPVNNGVCSERLDLALVDVEISDILMNYVWCIYKYSRTGWPFYT
jgi:hypothetical protein